ncbi:hypothetical protein SADUNF_Sadunf05G0122800 [Salix dunnii]|uniref:Hexosyltransferase n=1 Tax=Salix dunnii TaxID=1413687 RepID=A0A835K822_9ROSI|nr:hypothetical protein SADUNF_Sadunf05G0122800 [Salix dunnii]
MDSVCLCILLRYWKFSSLTDYGIPQLNPTPNRSYPNVDMNKYCKSSMTISQLTRDTSSWNVSYLPTQNPSDVILLLEQMDSQENWSIATSNSLLDRAIDSEDAQHKDFLRLEHVEGYHELSAKTKFLLSSAVAMWDAEFYVKVDDDVHVIWPHLRHRSKPRVYTGCMKSGPVLSQNIMNQSIGNLERRETATSDMQRGRYTLSQKNLPPISPLTSPYCISKPMNTCVLVHGLLVLRLSSLMTATCAVGHHQVKKKNELWFMLKIVTSLNIGFNLISQIACLEQLGIYMVLLFFSISNLLLDSATSDCEWKALAGNACIASFDCSCSVICKSVEKIKFVNEKCGEGDESAWSALF